MHYKCQQQTGEVAVQRSCFKLRGLRWCPTCRELVSRDQNACQNIALSFRSEERPTYLCRTTPRDDILTKLLQRGGARTLRESVSNHSYNRTTFKWQPRQTGCLLELVQDWKEVPFERASVGDYSTQKTEMLF